MTTPPVRYRARQSAVFAELADGTGVVLDLTTKAYFTLNPTGVAVWKALAAEPLAGDALAERLVRDFAVEGPRAVADVAALLRNLEDEALVDRL